MPFAAIGAAAAAIVAALAIMVKGGMVERPAFAGGNAGPGGLGGSADGSGLSLDDTGEDPFKRYPRPRDASAGPEPTQAETQQLSNDTWGSDGGGPAVTFESAGDGGGTSAPAQEAAANPMGSPQGGYYNPPIPKPPPGNFGSVLGPLNPTSPGGGIAKAV